MNATEREPAISIEARRTESTMLCEIELRRLDDDMVGGEVRGGFESKR